MRNTPEPLANLKQIMTQYKRAKSLQDDIPLLNPFGDEARKLAIQLEEARKWAIEYLDEAKAFLEKDLQQPVVTIRIN